MRSVNVVIVIIIIIIVVTIIIIQFCLDSVCLILDGRMLRRLLGLMKRVVGNISLRALAGRTQVKSGEGCRFSLTLTLLVGGDGEGC